MRHSKIIFFVILITLPTVLPFFNTRFFYTQDHIFIARLNQMSAALSDGHFPVRWAPDLRYGEPIYNFYAPLPYYFGALIHTLGFNFIWVSKILFILSSILSALTMYVFARLLFSKKGAFLATVLYVYAPYRAVDLYVRGALSETWAFVFFPLIFYASILLSEKVNLKRISFLSLTLAGLFLTHNVTTLMFLPFLGLWWIYLLFKDKNWKLILSFAGSFTLGLGLAAFFLLPALFESSFIQTKYLTVGYFNFRAHFVAYGQFFSTFWGYGSSLWGLDDGLSFQIGLAHWATLVLALCIGFIYIKKKKPLSLLIFLGGSFLLSLFLQHNKSAFVWEAIPPMAFIQFPWRFLTISIFLVAIAGGVIADYLGRFKIIYFILVGLIIILNINYFRPKEYVDNSFFDKFLYPEIMRTGRDLTKDYLPIWVKTTDGPPLNYLEAEEGSINVLGFEKKTAFASAQVNVLSDSLIVVPIAYFPGWTVMANGKNISLEKPLEQGLIRFKLPVGTYNIKFELKDTYVRLIGNFISLSSLLVLILFRYKRKKI